MWSIKSAALFKHPETHDIRNHKAWLILCLYYCHKANSPMFLLPQAFPRASWNVDLSENDGKKNLAAARTPCWGAGAAQTAAFVGIVMECELLNLSTCVLNVCSRKYWREMELPVAPQFIIPRHRLRIYDTTLEAWRPSRGWSNDTESAAIGSFKWVMTKPAMPWCNHLIMDMHIIH